MSPTELAPWAPALHAREAHCAGSNAERRWRAMSSEQRRLHCELLALHFGPGTPRPPWPHQSAPHPKTQTRRLLGWASSGMVVTCCRARLAPNPRPGTPSRNPGPTSTGSSIHHSPVTLNGCSPQRIFAFSHADKRSGTPAFMPGTQRSRAEQAAARIIEGRPTRGGNALPPRTRSPTARPIRTCWSVRDRHFQERLPLVGSSLSVVSTVAPACGSRVSNMPLCL